MYDNSREEKYKSRRHSKNKPSFSSTLLDQIYRSIDANAEDFKPKKDVKISQKAVRFVDEEMVDHKKFTAKRRPTLLFPEDNDFLFFSSTSSSSDSSGALSSSDTEFFFTKSKVSCLRPKPVRTENQTNKCEDDMIKSKSRASKIYANFRKVKQPISPGGRLTSFLNSLFHNTKGKNLDPGCSRSCLSKCPDGTKTVRINPLGVIGDKHSRGGHRSYIYHDKSGRPPLSLPNAASAESRDIKAHDALRGFHIQRDQDKPSMFTKTRVKEEDDHEDEDEDGVLSDSSSDLFELDHLNMFGNELPVYETTTRLDTAVTKRGGVSRLIR